MWSFEDQMAITVDVLPLLFGIAAPEQKNDTITFAVYRLNHSVGKRLPTFSLMRASLPLNNGEHTVEQ